MRTKFLFVIAVLSLCFIHTDNLDAQTTTSSHAHATSRQWKGIDVLDILANPGNYPGIYDKDIGYPIYLYNVGTGKFVVDGGNYGMEARLFHEDFGRKMKLFIQDGVLKINPDINEATGTTNEKYLLTCNIPNITKGSSWADASSYSLTTIMDGYYYWGKWNFERIPSEDANSEFHTYYMYQQHDANYGNSKAYSKINTTTNPNREYQNVDVRTIKFYYGAAYGEWCSDGTMTYADNSTNDKGCGYYVNVDDDRSCWTTAGNSNNSELSPKGNTTTVLVNGDMVPIDELYQWRIISADEFNRVLTEEVVGINPSISSLVPDRDFTRNSDDFFGHWYTTTNPLHTYGTDKRYGFTWGNCVKGKLQSWTDKEASENGETDQKILRPYRWTDDPWDQPLMLKKVFGNMKQSKYGFMSFEGVGTVWVSFEVPHPGWYQIEASAISFSTNPSHKAYMYAKANWVTVTDELINAVNNSYLGYGQVEIKNVPSVRDNTFAEKYSYDRKVEYPSSDKRYKNNEVMNLPIGQILTLHGEDYREKFWIYLNPTDYASSDDNKKLTIGFQKDFAIKSAQNNNRKLDGIDYYYDEDWICVDDIKVSYMGLAPAFFYEDEENLDYLVYNGDYVERPSAQPNGQYSGALSLERTMKTNQWNSFSFPIPLTGEQIRLAFGEDAELLKLHSIGGLSNNSNIIDFQTVDLKQTVTDPTDVPKVVEPGKMYLLKPTADPVEGKDPFGRLTTYYQLGRNFFAIEGNENVPANYAHEKINTSTPYATQNISSYNDENDGQTHVSYVRTPGAYNSDGTKKTTWTPGNNDENLYAPNKAYVLATVNGVQKLFETNKATMIKGFRGWITLTKSLFDTNSEVKISIDGVVDGEEDTTGITGEEIPIPVSDNTTVYDLCGRMVGTVGTTSLPRGIYIIAGKKVFVK